MQPKQQRALELILAGHSVTDIAAQVGVRRETVWRWRNDPLFASEVSVRQAQRRQSSHESWMRASSRVSGCCGGWWPIPMPHQVPVFALQRH